MREMDRLEGRLNFVGYNTLVNQVDAGLGVGLERVRVPQADRRVPAGGHRVASRGDQPEQPRLAHVGDPAGAE